MPNLCTLLISSFLRFSLKHFLYLTEPEKIYLYTFIVTVGLGAAADLRKPKFTHFRYDRYRASHTCTNVAAALAIQNIGS